VKTLLCALLFLGCSREEGPDPKCGAALATFAPDPPAYADAVAAACGQPCGATGTQGTCADGKIFLESRPDLSGYTSFYSPSGELVGVTAWSDVVDEQCPIYFYGTLDSIRCDHAQSEPIQCPSDGVQQPPECLPGEARCTVSGGEWQIEICLSCQKYAAPTRCSEVEEECLDYCPAGDAAPDAG
jgi:hypothetical protein